jgi:hypothetical protein
LSPSLQEMPPPESGEPGWYPDPLGSPSQRYWDGTNWLTKVQGGGGGRSINDRWRGLSTWGKVGVSVGGVVVLLIIISAASGGSSKKDSGATADAGTTASSNDSSGDSSTPDESKSPSTGGDPSENASDDNTPSVGPHGSIEVDTLRWSMSKASTSKTIGDQEFGLGAKSNGVFVIAQLSVTNNKTDSVTITSEVINLVAGKDTYKPDSDAEIALIGEGGNTFFLEDIGPGVTAKGTVAFDVAPSVLNEHPQLLFKELGFGETHGYIALPPLSK